MLIRMTDPDALLRWQVGDVRITRVPETLTWIPLTELLPAATPDALAPHRRWLEPHFLDADGAFPISIHGLVVEAAGQRILVDTCLGSEPVPGFEMIAAAPRDFLGGLATAGFARETIDVVLCTHLHFDHVGWNTLRENGELVPAFPNARYLFARVEWQHWSASTKREAYTPTFDTTVRPIVDAGLADFVETDHKLCDGVRLVPSPGHTPGHVSVRIESQGQRALITGDMTHHPVQWAEPDWPMPADTDPAAAAETRRRLGAELADEQALVIGTHYGPPCAGRLERGARGLSFATRR